MMQMVLAAAQADPVSNMVHPPVLDPLKLARRTHLPPPSLSRRKRPPEDEVALEMSGLNGGWVEEAGCSDPNAKYLFRYDPITNKRDGEPGSDEGIITEPSGRRVERKDRKNKREQERRKEINDRFALLSDLLFGSKFSGRVDKTQILDRAIDLVRHGPSILRNNENLVMDPLPPDADPLAGRENWPGDIPKTIHLPPGMRYRDCPPSCPAPHCHSEPSDMRDMSHLKYAQSSYSQSPYPQYSHHGHPQSFSSGYHPPYFQQPQFAHSHTNFPVPKSNEHPHMCGRGRGGRCIDCEGDSSTSPEMRNYRNMASNGANCRTGGGSSSNTNNSGSTMCNVSHWGSSHATRGRKDNQTINDNQNTHEEEEIEDNPPDKASHNLETHEGQCNSSRSSSSVMQRHFSESRSTNPQESSTSHLPTGRTKAGFDPLLKGDASIGMQVALLDTLVQLSQNSKRAKK